MAEEFRQIYPKQEHLVWDRLNLDDTWQNFVSSLWGYQYVRKSSALTAQLSNVLYDESQGITDFVVKLYMLVQIESIASGQEVVTAELIRLVARKNLKIAHPVLDALRKGDMQTLMHIEDIHKSAEFDAFLNHSGLSFLTLSLEE